jgi:transcriptional regulator with XRE-family HTH domain
MEEEIEGRFYTYTLAYPEDMNDGKVFYVGKGSGNRMHMHVYYVQHEYPERSRNPHKDSVIRVILNAGKVVRVNKVAEFATEKEAFIYERFLINEVYGKENLTNLTAGGEGNPPRHGETRRSQTTKKYDTSILQRLRVEANMTLPELVAATHVSSTTFLRMIKGERVTREKVEIVLDVLGERLGRKIDIEDIDGLSFYDLKQVWMERNRKRHQVGEYFPTTEILNSVENTTQRQLLRRNSIEDLIVCANKAASWLNNQSGDEPHSLASDLYRSIAQAYGDYLPEIDSEDIEDFA